ncbi:MAG: PilZ domain-containing protein [Methylococcaceae bacterium]|nr:PilZ domain-containing protein [Methylococcaceae bacterium]
MDTDKRRHPRFSPKGLTANITIFPPPPDQKIILKGTIVDMSYTGIKIKLNTAIKNKLPESEITITLTMPESGVPITIRGIIKHINTDSECGLQYSEKYSEHEVDDLMFECIKIADNHTQDEE